MSGRRGFLPWLMALAMAAAAVPRAAAHIIPSSQHDRKIQVWLDRRESPGQLRVRVKYRLELAEDTSQMDMLPFLDEVDFKEVKKNRLGFSAEFTRIYAPILARNFLTQLDGRPLKFTCLDRQQTLRDEKGQALGHLRCDFVFQAVPNLLSEQEYLLSIEEKNFPDKTGDIQMSLHVGEGIRALSKSEPAEALRNRPLIERSLDDEKKLRSASARFVLEPRKGDEKASSGADGKAPIAPGQAGPPEDDHGLLELFLSSEHGFWLLLLLSAWIGAAHALTPGHGKTLMAAYLVGQRGTVGHAVVLGLVTTLTHTGAVLILAAVLQLFSGEALQKVQSGLGLAMGLVIACLGFWLLLQRLAGRADHVHIGAGHHHHHDGPGHHHQHAPAPAAADGKVTWWGLIVLGMSGGIVPCWDAIIMLGLAIGSNQLALALPMLLAFSAGLAGVLVALGILVVQMRNFAGSHWGQGRIVRSLPLVSAVLVTAMGVWLCYESIQVRP